ncbi:MAG: ABC transporter substrate-binding protein [Planctomycetota bacterium]
MRSIGALLISALMLTGCGKDKEAAVDVDSMAGSAPEAKDAIQGGTFTWGRSGDASYLDPAVVTDGESVMVVTNIFDTLVAYEPGTINIIPWLAESWETSADDLLWTFKLREGVKFHDGSDCDADAVVFSVMRQKDKDHPAHVGTFAYYSDNFALLKNVEAVDKHTVRFTLSRKYAPFLATMSLFSMGVVSPTAWASEGKDKNGKYKYDFAHHPVGSGPFQFKEWKIDERIVLVANENHFMGRPHVDRLVFRPIKDARARLKDLQADGVQAMDNPDLVDIAGAEADPDLTVLSQPGLNVCYMAMNTMRAPFDNVKVRQAIALAIHKKRLIAAAYHGIGEPAATMCPKGIVGHLDIESRKPDIEAAKKLLAEAGFPDGFETELWHGDVQRAYMPDPDAVAIQIQLDLKDIGVRATIKRMEWSAYIPATRRGEHSMCLLGWMADYGDPHNFLYVLMDKDNARVGSANNVSFYRGEAYSKLVHAAQEESDPTKRIALYEDAQRILHDESPTVPLVQIPDFRVVRKNVRGLYIYPVGGEYFRTVSFAK